MSINITRRSISFATLTGTAYTPLRSVSAAHYRSVSLLSNRFIRPMLYSPAFTFASIHPLGVFPCAGLRLSGLRQFQAFLASSACAACARRYRFWQHCAASIAWCFFAVRARRQAGVSRFGVCV